jgi:membrane protease YdiL (CAAX protease family)
VAALDIICGMNPFSDRQFQLAWLAGPATWLALWPWLAPAYFNPAWPLQHPLPLLLAVLAYPPLEEILFRGWLQQSLMSRPKLHTHWLLSPANLIASLLFAAAHLWRHNLLLVMAVFLPSLIFGYFYERHRGLCSPILLHGWYNLGFVYCFTAGN